jgi:hypothetical protein
MVGLCLALLVRRISVVLCGVLESSAVHVSRRHDTLRALLRQQETLLFSSTVQVYSFHATRQVAARTAHAFFKRLPSLSLTTNH